MCIAEDNEHIGRCTYAISTISDREQAFWIDQICINQDDNREQGHQIAMMDDIFYRAAQLVVWLGKQDHDTELAFTTIEQACQELESQCRLETISQTDLEYVNMADSSGVLRIKDWFSVRDLLSRPWFNRLWIRTSRFSAHYLIRTRLFRRFVYPIQKTCKSSVGATKSHGGVCRSFISR